MELLLGHLFGDYIFQNNWMALNKAKFSLEGWIACLIHCLIYSITVCLFTKITIIWFVIIFLSHFIIDKFPLVEWYLHIIKGRSIKDCIENINFVNMNGNDTLQISVTILVYVVCDNTLHLFIMYYSAKYLGIEL